MRFTTDDAFPWTWHLMMCRRQKRLGISTAVLQALFGVEVVGYMKWRGELS